MTTLDNPNTYPDPSEVPPWPTAIRYGLIGGLIFIVYGLIGNLTGLGRPTAGLVAVAVFGLLVFVLYIGLLYFAIRKHRDEDLGGYITIGRSVMVGVVVAILAGIISSVFNYLYMTLIEPDMAATIVEEMREMFESLGMDEDMIEEQLADVASRMNPAKQLIQGLIGSGVMGAIFSLIIGAILKKTPANEV